jgi:hypothetical protein
MTAMRDHVVLAYALLIATALVLTIAGFWGWNGWLQLGAVAVTMLACSRLAPVYFGWREPDDHRHR